MTTVITKRYRPITKLQQLIDLKRARFPVGKGIRAGLSIGLTFAIGLLTGYGLEGVFVCIAALCFSAGEASNMTYRAMFRHTLIAASIGGLGAFAGVMIGLPWFVTIIIMALIAFLCAVISNYGTPYSVGTMIALVMSSVVIGIPVEGMGWKLFICFQIGTAFYLFLLGCEALIDSHYPERQLLSKHIKMQADYARTKSRQLSEPTADKITTQKSLEDVLDSYFALYAALLNRKHRNASGRNLETDKQAAVLQALDSVLSHLNATNKDAALLLSAADWLDTMADAVDNKNKKPPQPPPAFIESGNLFYSIARLSDNLWSSSLPETFSQKPATTKIAFTEKSHRVLRRLIVGKEATMSALIFSACMGTAFATKYFITANHWYWVPLTVALTMKPDFGSVFSRAITRSVGTVLGALVGTLLLLILPKDFTLVIAIGVLAAMLPWAKMMSYTTQVIAITAILLVLLDLLSNGPHTVNYASQRVADTILASLIVLVFSYLIWPRNKHEEFSQKFNDILGSIKKYFASACQSDNGDKKEFERISKEVFKKKITAYQQLSDLRASIYRLVIEPAPVGTEATSWLPLASAAERLCDKIDIYFIHRTVSATVPKADDVDYLLSQIEMVLEQKIAQAPHVFSERNTEQVKSFLFDISDEIGSLSKLLQKNSPALP